MTDYQNSNLILKSLNRRPFTWLFVGSVVIYGLAIAQDYVFSVTKQTGFYLSESGLYNTFWLLFVPLLWYNYKIAKVIVEAKSKFKISRYIVCITVFALLHILLFTSIFTGLSQIFFTPSHRFSSILKSVLSNYMVIMLLLYGTIPIVIIKLNQKRSNGIKEYPVTEQTITVKKGLKSILVPISSIQYIKSNRPFTNIVTESQVFLTNYSLKELTATIKSDQFIRVHKSTIVNRSFILELESRKNGDYNAKMKNGQSIRLSRHYREYWDCLLHL